jgi:hypothetical protein
MTVDDPTVPPPPVVAGFFGMIRSNATTATTKQI